MPRVGEAELLLMAASLSLCLESCSANQRAFAVASSAFWSCHPMMIFEARPTWVIAGAMFVMTGTCDCEVRPSIILAEASWDLDHMLYLF